MNWNDPRVLYQVFRLAPLSHSALTEVPGDTVMRNHLAVLEHASLQMEVGPLLLDIA
jgi:hypothetical protein